MDQKRRQAGTGSVKQLPSGSWRFRITTGGRRYGGTVAAGPDAEAQAHRQLDALRALLCEAPPMPGLSLGAWGLRWLEARKTRNAEHVVQDWQRHVVGAELGSIPLAEVTRRDVKKWLRALASQDKPRRLVRGGKLAGPGYSKNTLMVLRSHVRLVLAAAMDEGLISSNPADAVKIEGTAAEVAHIREYLEPDQIAALFAQPLPEAIRAAYAVGCYAGLRPGEMIALHREDVYLGDQPRIVVRRSHGRTTKTGSARTVPLLEPARAALEAWLAVAPESELVWPSVHGGRYQRGYDFHWNSRPARAGGHLARIGWRERAGLPASKELYSLRHTCATGLLQGWWGPAWRLEEVQQMLGHSSITTTQIYAKISGSHLLNKAREMTFDSGPRQAHGRSHLRLVPDEKPAAFKRAADVLEYGALPPGSARGCVESGLLPGAQAARELLETVAAGRAVPAELLQRLLDAARQHPIVRLIDQVESGGPRVLGAALQLAGEMLGGQQVEEGAACR